MAAPGKKRKARNVQIPKAPESAGRTSRASEKPQAESAPSAASAMDAHHGFVQEQVAPYEFGGRERSAALLAWFLEHVWRLDEVEVEDAVCDGKGDKGIDGLVVNADSQEVEVFQSAHVVSPHKTQGDQKIKAFKGVAAYFRDAESVQALLDSKPREELRQLVERNKIKERLGGGEGWSVRLVYVTDAVADSSATDYLKATAGDSPQLDLWDLERIHPVATRTAARDLLDETVTLPTQDVLLHGLRVDEDMAVAIVKATDLVLLPGIDTLGIFDLNVRLSMGRTRINRDLAQAIRTEPDHGVFLAYHNGMTLLTRSLKRDPQSEDLILSGVSVVNGCQSLLALYDNRSHLTDDLAILVKVVQLGDDRALAEQITYRSNNQNPVNFRDQRSTDSTQVALQRQMEERHGERLFYRIREGEPPPEGVSVLDNRLAAQLLMAVYVGEPHRAVRKVALFDNEYHRIFQKEVDADRLYLLAMLDRAVSQHREKLTDELAAAFASVRFTVISLTSAVVSESERGAQLFEDPGRWLPERDAEVEAQLSDVALDVIDSVNFHVEEQSLAQEDGASFDPKVVFKSEQGVRRLRQRALQDAKSAARRDERKGLQYGFDVGPVR